jgi:hypothetical protein
MYFPQTPEKLKPSIVVSKYIQSICTFKLRIDEENLAVSVHILNNSEETHNKVHKDGCRYADRHDLWGFFCEDSFHQIVRLFHFALKKNSECLTDAMPFC